MAPPPIPSPKDLIQAFNHCPVPMPVPPTHISTSVISYTAVPGSVWSRIALKALGRRRKAGLALAVAAG
jgi:hypothetical protein